jgi:hypothetical protein
MYDLSKKRTKNEMRPYQGVSAINSFHTMDHNMDHSMDHNMDHTVSKPPLSIGSKVVVSHYKETYTYKIIKEIESHIICGSNIPNNDNVVLHSFDDQPSCEREDCVQSWYKDGQLHRDNDKPALIKFEGHSDCGYGVQQWSQNGQTHREGDQPAMIFSNGDTFYFKNDQIHRDDDKPAIMLSDGTRKWFSHGELHRVDDKPAIIMTIDGQRVYHYYRHGEEYDP